MYRNILMSLLVCSGCFGCPIKQSRPEEQPSKMAATQGLRVEEINKMIAATWSAEEVSVAPVADDAEFLRRVSLDLIGRIPTADEARAFLDDKQSDKRARVVDRLLESSEYAEHWADLYSDLLISNDFKNLAQAKSPREYLTQSFQQNKPYDQLMTELITATGDLQGNGAVAFVASQQSRGGKAERVAATTVELFLGIQLQCAQCHDHPYDARYKQEDFYGIVSYFSQTRLKVEKEQKSISIYDAPRGEAKMKRPGAEKEEKVNPKFLGKELSLNEGQTRRQALAEAIKSSDLFAKSAVNRTWAQLFGRGIIDPVNDLGGENDSGHPELLVKLSEDFASSGYDQRALLRKIVLSDAYALSSRGEANPEADPAQRENVFARAAVRPLSASQLFRSIFIATNIEEMAKNKLGGDDKMQKMKERARREYQFVFGDDEMAEVSTFDGNVPQALVLLNGEVTNRGSLSKAGSNLEKILAASQDKATRIESIFLTLYGRRPTQTEQETLSAYLTENKEKPQAYEDIFFALLTSTEFITNH